MESIKKIVIDSGKCVLCGLCEQDEFSNIFCNENGRISVLNSGLVDIRNYPQLLELMDMCPAKAMHIENEENITGNREEVLAKLISMVNKELRDYPFTTPPSEEYEYKTGTYAVARIPAVFRSEEKYLTDYHAEEAGLAAFKQAVWSQYSAVARQYITAYKVKKLKRFFCYEESRENYYYATNKKIEALLKKAYTLAQVATDQTISLPDDFCSFNVMPDWGYDNKWYLDAYNTLEDCHFDYEHARSFHQPDWYRTWIAKDGSSKYSYDFSEAEEVFRSDMDSVVDDVLYDRVRQDVESVTERYHKAAKELLVQKADVLQSELKKSIKVSGKDSFSEAICAVIKTIKNTPMIEISAPNAYSSIDIDYNGDYRFYSRSSCENAANNRIERAHNEGRYFIRQLPDALNLSCMEQLQKILTKWKRDVLNAYDLCGCPYPKEKMNISIGASREVISLNSFDDPLIPGDDSIKEYIDKAILQYGTSVNSVTFMSESSCERNIHEDFDIKETIFGNIKEVNHRYSYSVFIHEFASSADSVAEECVKELIKSPFMRDFFQNIKNDFIKELIRVTGVKTIS